ncbi:OLC1v1025354C1 [Oldenlandia corymbosa var. corymbosa]|uniref:OLC1v1025354C1 n=1 Tax=Oldenlandia corymbosa var. corymbosa TaxID=529605 RepID=A0AAV1C4K8_OLDCO|nr:OLC1v1025354C1 [Oldenlandia corymbosa var. corymbosa]
MAEFINNHRKTGQTIGVINGKAYDASNVYVIRSRTNNNNDLANDHNHHHFESPGRTYQHQGVSKPASYNTHKSSTSKATTLWMDYRQFKRKKRIATYKLYAYEGKVKNSFKNGIRWIKLKCRKIVHGF